MNNFVYYIWWSCLIIVQYFELHIYKLAYSERYLQCGGCESNLWIKKCSFSANERKSFDLPVSIALLNYHWCINTWVTCNISNILKYFYIMLNCLFYYVIIESMIWSTGLDVWSFILNFFTSVTWCKIKKKPYYHLKVFLYSSFQWHLNRVKMFD